MLPYHLPSISLLYLPYLPFPSSSYHRHFDSLLKPGPGTIPKKKIKLWWSLEEWVVRHGDREQDFSLTQASLCPLSGHKKKNFTFEDDLFL